MDRNEAVLRSMLGVAVPMWAARAAAWDRVTCEREAIEAAHIIACGGDSVIRDCSFSPADIGLPTVVGITTEQMRLGVKARDYRPAEIFNAVAKGLGIGALLPGGVTFLGQHWCIAPHGSCTGVIRLPEAVA